MQAELLEQVEALQATVRPTHTALRRMASICGPAARNFFEADVPASFPDPILAPLHKRAARAPRKQGDAARRPAITVESTTAPRRQEVAADIGEDGSMRENMQSQMAPCRERGDPNVLPIEFASDPKELER